MALITLGGTGGLLLVAPDALDVERVLLGTHLAGIGNVRVLAVAFETALGFIRALGSVMAHYAVVLFLVSLVGKCDGVDRGDPVDRGPHRPQGPQAIQ